MRSILVTGSSGLIGSAVVDFFHQLGFAVHGVDNNQRAAFFGISGDTRWRQQQLTSTLCNFYHHEQDIRNRKEMLSLVKKLRPSTIIHAAAQPSHDFSAEIPVEDFEINAIGTLNILEAARQFCPEAAFIHLSTNKVYGDHPNRLSLLELETRWDYADPFYADGIPETFSIDQTLHTPFGASKVAADIMVQEYGRYYGMPTCCIRGGCLTGAAHSSVESHGFLSFLVKRNLQKREYTVFGYQGKQVRDSIHCDDVASFIHAFSQTPRSGEVYNLGGGKDNSCSILEAFALVKSISGIDQRYRYDEHNRKGDHLCYYSDLTKIKAHYPKWCITRSLTSIIEELVNSWHQRLQA